MTIEKKLAEKVLYAIHIKDSKSIEETRRPDFNYLNIIKEKTDFKLFEKVNSKLNEHYKEVYYDWLRRFI